MSQHPYTSLPDYAYWRRAISTVHPELVDPVVKSAFRITKHDKVATAGSCFAQHIARYLQNSGFNYFVSEEAHPMATPKLAREFGYGDFTARYGNIYTSRQLLQLFDRAYGDFQPVDPVWKRPDGKYVDPFRPQIQPTGFASIAELKIDQKQHFSAVRDAFENLDVFVFTLGLTEVWVSKEDGSAYPLCPGVAAGEFDEGRHAFVNLGVDDVASEMIAFIKKLRTVNENAKVILTVSPVPLIATAEDRHVLVSTTYSKSVLRVAAEKIVNSFDNVAYFPSFEIITGDYSRGKYFARDCRSVLETGVAHVMRLFLEHYTVNDDAQEQTTEPPDQSRHDAHMSEMENLVAVNCDEEILERGGS